jgi:hypothetical protein
MTRVKNSRASMLCSWGSNLLLRSGLYLGPSGGAIGILGVLEGPVPCTWVLGEMACPESRSGSL